MNLIVIEGQLRSALDDPEVIAPRLGNLLEMLLELNPLFSDWRRTGSRHRSAVPAIVTLPPDEIELHRWVEEGAMFESHAGRKRCVGYWIRALTPETNQVRADFWLRLNFTPGAQRFASHVGLTLVFAEQGRSRGEDQGSVKNLIEFLRRSLLALALAWNCEWAAVAPGDFRWAAEHPADVPPVQYRSGWMVYLDTGLATGLADIQGIEVEKAPSGVLLTAASNAVFNYRDPIHKAAALRIQAALAPLNEAQNN